MRDALAAGHSREEIHTALSQAGWPDDEIADGLSRFSEGDFPIPVPRKKAAGWARDAFLYLLTFAALYTSAVALGELLSGLVDHFLPDKVQDRYSYGDQNDGLRWCIASLLVTFPLYVGLTRKHFIEYARDASRRTSPVRNWLTYLTLYVMALVQICTLIALVGSVLGGELALRSILKIAIVLVISGAIFIFYLWEIRWKERDPRS